MHRENAPVDLIDIQTTVHQHIPSTWTRAPELDKHYRRCNYLLFDNKLDDVPCYWSEPSFKYKGRCLLSYNPQKRRYQAYAIEVPCNSPDGSLYKTLIHEQVHVLQGVRRYSIGHDARFSQILRHKLRLYRHFLNSGQLKEKEPLWFPPLYQPQNRYWKSAPEVSKSLHRCNKLFFNNQCIIPQVYWHSTRKAPDFRIYTQWCHHTQSPQPIAVELSQKTFSHCDDNILMILSRIAALGILDTEDRYSCAQKIYDTKRASLPYLLSRSGSPNPKGMTQILLQQGTGSGKTHNLHLLYQLIGTSSSR